MNPNRVNIPEIHLHELEFSDSLIGHRCDVCKTFIFDGIGYSCHKQDEARYHKCDFDYCIKCYNANIFTINELEPLFDLEPYACDFYKKVIFTYLDSEYYKQIIDMFFKKVTGGGRVNWSLRFRNNETSAIFSYYGLKCESCRLTVKIDPVGALAGIKCTGTDKKEHLNSLVHILFEGKTEIELSGVYCS